jgi:hypothetical protein
MTLINLNLIVKVRDCDGRLKPIHYGPQMDLRALYPGFLDGMFLALITVLDFMTAQPSKFF